MLSLFRAIIPASHRHEVATVPRTAAVLHNDCIFFAHHCLTLGLEYREQYSEEDARGKLLRQSCIFVDMVPLFRELADLSMGDMLDLQADQLVEIVGSRISYLGESLRSNESLQEWSDAETAMAAGIYHLRHLAQSWRPILSKRIFCQSIGHLSDVLLTLYWKQVTNMARVITPNARHFLLGLFRKACQDLKELFLEPQPERCIEDCSDEWGRFLALVEFLDIPNLTQVQAALASGVFRQVSGQELAKWIEALYPHETPERTTLLQSVLGA
jgi:centromere/kinetochore protein ZW10